MVVAKRLSRTSDSSDSNGQPMPSPSPLRRMHDDDVSGMEAAMLRTRKQLKTNKPLVSSSVSKLICTKNDELIILGGIVDYENEKKLSYRFDWDAFYCYIKDSIEANFSKKQLIDKINKLKKRFTDNMARSNDGKEFSFTDTDDDDIFRLSMIIWVTNDEEKVHVVNEDVTYEPASNISKETDNGVDESCVLQDALEAATWFQSLSKFRQKFLFKNLKKLEVETRKELSDEWKAMVGEELQLKIKNQTFFAKLVNL